VKLSVITEQLSRKLPKKNVLQKQTIVNPANFDSIYKLLNSHNITELNITDATYSKEIAAGKMVQVNDHINKTGSNPLIGKQELLDIDFIVMAGVYSFEKKAIATVCCGETLNKKYIYPSHFLCHISILANALKIQTIKGNLYNIL
jgi:hypothetical protein